MSNESSNRRENGNYVVQSLIKDVEQYLLEGQTYSEEIKRYRAYFERMGGRVLTNKPIFYDTRAIAVTFDPLTHSAHVNPLNPNQPIKTKILKVFRLEDILAQDPAFPDFWNSVAESGLVSDIVYTQDPYDKSKGKRDINIGKDGDIVFPNCNVQFPTDSSIRVRFEAPHGMVLRYPHCIANETFSFTKDPAEIDRAFRVYKNYYDTNGIPLFSPFPKIAIEYIPEQPNRMRPKILEN